MKYNGIANFMDFMTCFFSVSYVLDSCPGTTQTVFRADQTEVACGVTAGFTYPPPFFPSNGAFDLSVPGSGLTIPNEVPAGGLFRTINFNIRIDDFSQDSTIMTILDNSSPPRGITMKLESTQLVIDIQFPILSNFAEEAVITYTQAELGGGWNQIRLTLAAPPFDPGYPLAFYAGITFLDEIFPTVGPPQYNSFISGDIVISQFVGALSCITIDNNGDLSGIPLGNTACVESNYTRKFELLIF